MKIKSILIISAIIIILLFGSYLFQTTYSKFRKNLNSDTNISIASWNIKVNEESILGKSTLTSNIIPVFPGNEYVKENVIAPNATGYYDIVIDASSVDVSFNYIITPTVSPNSDITDLIVTSYSIDNGDIIDYTDNISGSINYGNNQIIRIYIKWDDSINNNMDNKDDTDIAINSNSKAIISNSIVFSQKN